MKQITLFQSEDAHESKHSNASLDTRSSASGTRIFFPCPEAREMPIGEARCNHIKNCSECKRLIQELDKEVGYERNAKSEIRDEDA